MNEVQIYFSSVEKKDLDSFQSLKADVDQGYGNGQKCT
jgi:hypothetical protein